MTEKEARMILDVRISRFDHAGDVNEALETAKQALEEIQKYREIGTIEECREAVKKLGIKKCPFCGGTIRIQPVDGEGNFRDKDYTEYPYSGLGYVLVHDTNTSKDGCPIATHAGDETHLGIWVYGSEEDAIEAWNRRAGEEENYEETDE